MQKAMRNTGMALEDEVFALLHKMLERDELVYKKDRCRLFRRKGYYSPDRDGLVNFENVIEVFRSTDFNDDTKPAHVVFYECKDSGRNVEVGEIDEIVARLGVSFGFSMKSYVVTRNGFARGALNTANSKGIGLIKLMPEGQIRVFLEFLTEASIAKIERKYPQRALSALLDMNYVATNESFYGLDNGMFFSSLLAMLRYHLSSLPQHE